MTKLSERLRPNVEAAPWVIEEIKKLEDEVGRMRGDLERAPVQTMKLHNGETVRVALVLVECDGVIEKDCSGCVYRETSVFNEPCYSCNDHCNWSKVGN